MSQTQHLKGWNKNRIYSETNCACSNCCTHSNVCAYCKDFSEPIDWNYTASNYGAPNITCTKCTNSYHRKCLPLKKRIANSWNICGEIEQDTKCSEYLDFFTFLKPIKRNKQSTKHEALIQKKYNEIHPNKKLIITAHFCGFQYKKWTFFLEDCTEILLNGESPAIGRIIDIFSTNDNNAYTLIQWYWRKNDFVLQDNNNNNNNNNDSCDSELLFCNDLKYSDLVAIETIKTKVKVFDTFQEYKNNKQKLQQLKQKQMDGINNLKKNKKNFSKLCLLQNVKGYKSVSFDGVFWSQMSCNGNINDKKIYKTRKNDTNKMRMQIQNKIINENISNTNNNKRKREFDDIITLKKHKKRKIDNDNVPIKNNNNNNNSNNSMISLDEYQELQKQNEKLRKENKKQHEEMLMLTKSLNKKKYEIDNYSQEQHKNRLEIINLREKKEKLKHDEKRKRGKLRDELKDKNIKISKLEQILQGQMHELTWLKEARNVPSNQNNNPNGPVPYHISSIENTNNTRPTDPRTNTNAQTNGRLVQQNMNPNQLRDLF